MHLASSWAHWGSSHGPATWSSCNSGAPIYLSVYSRCVWPRTQLSGKLSRRLCTHTSYLREPPLSYRDSISSSFRPIVHPLVDLKASHRNPFRAISQLTGRNSVRTTWLNHTGPKCQTRRVQPLAAFLGAGLHTCQRERVRPHTWHRRRSSSHRLDVGKGRACPALRQMTRHQSLVFQMETRLIFQRRRLLWPSVCKGRYLERHGPQPTKEWPWATLPSGCFWLETIWSPQSGCRRGLLSREYPSLGWQPQLAPPWHRQARQTSQSCASREVYWRWSARVL